MDSTCDKNIREYFQAPEMCYSDDALMEHAVFTRAICLSRSVLLRNGQHN